MVYEENQNAFVGTYEMAVRDPFHQNAEPAGEKRGRRMLRFTREKRRYIYMYFFACPGEDNWEHKWVGQSPR